MRMPAKISEKDELEMSDTYPELRMKLIPDLNLSENCIINLNRLKNINQTFLSSFFLFVLLLNLQIFPSNCDRLQIYYS